MSPTNDTLNQVQIKQNGTPLIPDASQEFRPILPVHPVQTVHEPKPDPRLTMSAVIYVIVLFTFLVLGIFCLRALNRRMQAKAATPPPEQQVAQTATNAAPTNVETTGAASTPADGTSGVAGADASPEPEPLKLQAVFFNPARPSAIISGSTVFVGDRVGGFRVARIGRSSATLVAGDQTIVLKMQ